MADAGGDDSDAQSEEAELATASLASIDYGEHRSIFCIGGESETTKIQVDPDLRARYVRVTALIDGPAGSRRERRFIGGNKSSAVHDIHDKADLVFVLDPGEHLQRVVASTSAVHDGHASLKKREYRCALGEGRAHHWRHVELGATSVDPDDALVRLEKLAAKDGFKYIGKATDRFGCDWGKRESAKEPEVVVDNEVYPGAEDGCPFLSWSCKYKAETAQQSARVMLLYIRPNAGVGRRFYAEYLDRSYDGKKWLKDWDGGYTTLAHVPDDGHDLLYAVKLFVPDGQHWSLDVDAKHHGCEAR